MATTEDRHATYKIEFGPVQEYLQATIIELVTDAKEKGNDTTEALNIILNEIFTALHHADWDLGADGSEFLVRMSNKIDSYLRGP